MTILLLGHRVLGDKLLLSLLLHDRHLMRLVVREPEHLLNGGRERLELLTQHPHPVAGKVEWVDVKVGIDQNWKALHIQGLGIDALSRPARVGTRWRACTAVSSAHVLP